MNFRTILSSSLAAGCLVAQASAAPSLVPDSSNLSPDYLCTWNLQGYATSYASTEAQRRAMDEAHLFGTDVSKGWIDLYPTLRGDLYFVMDDAWDVPLDGEPRQFGSLILDAARFPSFAEGTPEQRLSKLTQAVTAKGWRGLGGWVCAQQAPALEIDDERAYWTERLRWMKTAGFVYWKVDWGRRDRDVAWRAMLTELGHREVPQLIIEHALAKGSVRSAAVYRTYDVENGIAAPVTIGRIAELLKSAPAGSPTILNCEDEPYIAAGLGAAIGVMRHPFAGALPNGKPDFVFPAVGRDMKRRLDEVTRAVRWHRIAPPLPLGAGNAVIDDQTLQDTWVLQADETYTSHKVGDRREAAAPARVARGGLPLPTVEMTDASPPPFVLACRSTNGAVAIATIGRTLERAYVTPKARVTLDVGEADTIGVFGHYGAFTLRFDEALDRVTVLAQDLAGDSPIDLMTQATMEGNTLTIDGEVLAEVGRSAASADDLSEPGLVLRVQRSSRDAQTTTPAAP